MGLIVLVVLSGSCAGLLLMAYSEPSTAVLDSDLAEIRVRIKAAGDEDAKYAGGLIKVIVALEREVLRSTEAMLEQKRTSLIRRIDLRYTVEGRTLTPANDERLKQIADDLEKAGAALAEDQAEAARYAGGLVQTMALMTAATDRLNIAQLSLAYYGAKYGLALPVEVRTGRTDVPVHSSPGTVVKDKDAL